MRTVCTLTSALLLFAGTNALAGVVYSSIPPYYPTHISWLLINANVKNELKITKEQDKGVQVCINKMGETMALDGLENSRLKGPDHEAKMRVLRAKRAEELFQTLGQVLNAEQMKRLKQIALQWWGIRLFEHPEIREQLHLSDNQAKALRATYDKLIDDLTKKMTSGKIDQKVGQKQYQALQKGVPDQVRAQLTADQQATLRNLLGKTYQFE